MMASRSHEAIHAPHHGSSPASTAVGAPVAAPVKASEVYATSKPASTPILAAESSPSSSPATSPSAKFNSPLPPPVILLHESDASLDSHLHSHRQSHNSSKLPAFRFADRQRQQKAQKEASPLCSLPGPNLNSVAVPGRPISSQRCTDRRDPRAPAEPVCDERLDQRQAETAPNPLDTQGNQKRQNSLALDDTLLTLDASLHSSSLLSSHSHSQDHQQDSSLQCQESPLVAHAQDAQHQPNQRRASNNNTSTARDHRAVSPDPTPQIPSTLSSSSSVSSRSRPSAYRSISLDAAATHTRRRTTPLRNSSTTAATTPSRRYSNTHTARNLTSPLRNIDSVLSPSDSTETVIARHTSTGTESEPASPPDHPHHARGASSPTDTLTKEWAQGQRELILPKSLQRTHSDDRRSSIARRPPISYKPPAKSTASGATASTSIPPIRSFRSSGERRSLVPDMNLRSPRSYEGGDSFDDSDPRERSLRALEGRRPGLVRQQTTPPESTRDRPENDDSGDLFLKIAREDASRRTADRNTPISSYGDKQSAISRVARSSRRPLSVTINTSQPSTPSHSRRLSEQPAGTRSRGYSNARAGEGTSSPVFHFTGDRRTEGTQFNGVSTTARGSPLTSRSAAVPEGPTESKFAQHRRRQASIDANSAAPSRRSSLKQPGAVNTQSRTYNSSPLVPKPPELPRNAPQPSEANQGVEGTESTASTAAPSTVWDELDDLKSRIHRLELTGKLPPTSGAAMSRASDERPPTAHTNATTMSASPKRGTASVAQTTEISAAQKESHPLLHSALEKSKTLLNPDVFGSLESAAHDALSLASMMGSAGQPGPISSSASNGGGNGAVTDRQLRRKADSLCRSLTELCLALSEGAAPPHALNKPQQVTTPPADEDTTVTSPTIRFSSVASQRRVSIAPERSVSVATSPKTVSRPDERRNSSLHHSLSPRYSSTMPSTPRDASGSGRQTSLFLSRNRRAGTEDAEDGRRSSMLRTRRAVTEEPEDESDRRLSIARQRRGVTEEPEDLSDRKPLVVRHRRSTINDHDDDESRFRMPSRATTEVNGFRSHNREYHTNPATPSIRESREAEAMASSALPRRRVPGTTTLNTQLNSRVTQPTTASAIATPSRRYFDRANREREPLYSAEKSQESTSQRQISLARDGSLTKRGNRSSMIAAPPASGGYHR
ncbi:hypothetical protein F4780DRAFT_724951 [Xylariomycetidae sp. FL0641]|nr:hypothetical protein F4780DRAFT_724951 [Xylariomycetidae sp. FL0641]